MDRQNQQRILAEILEGLADTLKGHMTAGRVPESWDGIEIRHWVADIALELYAVRMDRARLRAYENTRIVANI